MNTDQMVEWIAKRTVVPSRIIREHADFITFLE